MQKGRSDFRAEKARAHDYHMLFGEKNFANRQCVAITSEVNDISQICSGHLWTASATSGSDAGLAKLNGLSIFQDRKPPFDIQLPDQRSETQFDALFPVPILGFLDQFFDRSIGISEKGFGERGALIWNIGFVADERQRAFRVILAQRVARAGAADATANNQIITLD